MAASTIEATLAQLQDEVSNCEKALLKLIKEKQDMPETATITSKTSIAIIGMASIFPQSRNLQEYWETIIQKLDCITEVPPSRWNIEDYYDPDPKAPDKTYCKRGGFIPEIDFNPLEFGLPPNILEVTDVSQLLSLVVAKAALADSGYGESRQFDRQRTGIVLGVAGGRQLGIALGARLQYPVWEKVLRSSGLSASDTEKIVNKVKSAYVPWQENSFPGMLGNVITGRIANRLDLGGMNCVVEAACASSLGALKLAISELVEHRADMMLTGGVETDNSIIAYMGFSKTPAVSPSESVRPFDAESDGMMLAEGIGMLVLKRLEDAQRDNDRIYAVIKGIGSSSDGRYKSIYAPRPEGQVLALRRAYEDAGFSPASVGLVEAHGTGTLAGDPAEFISIKEVFGHNNPRKQYIALGTVKSQIGHTKAAAGAASLIKTALALHHKVLPPTINITKPHPKLDIENSPFYLNMETRPWITNPAQPRRAAVSSFGFGGTNYHVVLEEFVSEHSQPYRLHHTPQSVLLFAATPEQLLSHCQAAQEQLESEAGERYYTELVAACQTAEIPPTYARVGFVADSLAQAKDLLQITIGWLHNRPQAIFWEHPQGIHYRQTGLVTAGRVVALFSGQGCQYLEMGRELVINFPCLRQTYADMDSLFSADGLQPVSQVVFPAPVFDSQQKATQLAALQQTEYSQPAIGVLSYGLYKILQQAGFKPDFVAGHSFGELTALRAGGVLSEADYFFLVKARGEAMAAPKDSSVDRGAMVAVIGDVGRVTELIKDFPQVTIANWNSPRQVVLAGVREEITQVQTILNRQGFSATLLSVSGAFHTPLVGYAQKPFAQAVEQVTFYPSHTPVYTNVTGGLYPQEPQGIKKILKEQIRNQVLFQQQIENIYAAGGNCFVEFGPKGILTNLVKEILKDQPHLAVALNPNQRQNSDRSLREAVVQLRVAGLSLTNLDPYQVVQDVPEVTKKPVLNVRLSGNNYVSEATKLAFEQAIQDGHQVSLPFSPPTEAVKNPDQEKVLVSSDMKSSSHEQRVIDSLESILTEFSRQQRDILNVHEQSLQHQTEYTKTFHQLMRQQQKIWGSGHFSEQQAQTQQLVISSADRSIMRFHDHQADTLRIHEQYLNYQQEYANNFCQLLQEQYQSLLMPDATPVLVTTPTVTVTTDEVEAPETLHLDPPTELPEITEDFAPLQIPELSAPTIELTALSQTLLSIVSDKTGYPVEMLELSMDVEADLGIDSIKRVEILGGLLELYPDLPRPNPEDIAQLRTLGQIVEFMKTQIPQGGVVEPPPAVEVLLEASPRAVDLPIEPTQLDLEQVSQTLLSIVSDKTGYPVEMLELSMDVEADLGIDSIKRVEILGGLLELYPDLPRPNPEDIAQLRTLGQIALYMQQQVTSEPRSNHSIPRCPVRLKLLPEPDILDFTLPQNHIALVTDDGSPTTGELAAALTARGWKTIVLSFPSHLIEEKFPLADGIQRVVLADLSEEHLQQQLGAIGAIGAFIHLNPAHQAPEVEKAILRHVFLMAKHLKEPLNRSVTQGRSCFLTVARLDGAFGMGRTTKFGAISGGLFGLTKTLDQEWESVFCRAIDLHPDLDPPTQVQCILAELYDPDKSLVDTGYSPQGRVKSIAEPVPISSLPSPQSSVPNPSSQVFLVSGGAKGITAQCVIKLAQDYQCKFILLGRSSRELEPVWAEGCQDEASLKQRIMEDFLTKGEKPTPLMVQKKYQSICSQREIQGTLVAIEQAGGEAVYLSVDITDGTLLQEKLANVVELMGKVTGIIHGAGTLADKRIEKKSIQDFETVYAAKVSGLENLLRCVSPEQLQYLILFSSVAGYYGNLGQSDYAIANEILNKSAHLFKLNYPNCHVVAMNWGPWDSGMVSPELKKTFAKRKIQIIPREVGSQILVDELAIANQDTVQVVIGSPLKSTANALPNELKNFRIRRRLTLAANPFLQDHVISGRPVLPTTCALTWITHGCEQLYPGYQVFACRNYKILKGIIFDENLAPEYILDLQEIAKNGSDEIEFDAKIWSRNIEGKIRYHFSGQVILQREIQDAPRYELLDLKQQPELITTKSLYQNGENSLFHGPTFHGVKSILNASVDKLTTECYVPQPEPRQQGQFPVQTFNPYTADVQSHALWIWSQHFHQEGCLPSEFSTFEQFTKLPFDQTFYVSCEIKSRTDLAVVADMITHDSQGQVYSRILGAKATILPKLGNG